MTTQTRCPRCREAGLDHLLLPLPQREKFTCALGHRITMKDLFADLDRAQKAEDAAG